MKMPMLCRCSREEQLASARQNRVELREALDSFRKDFSKSVEDLNQVQKENFFALLGKQGEQNTISMSRLDQMRETLERKISDMQSGNEKKLEEMRSTVDE